MHRFIFLMMQCCVVMSVSCPSDMNQDHRPRVSCVAQSLTAVPDGIKPDTQVLVLTGNHLSSLTWSSYSGFTQLHELDLSHNHITTLEPPGPVLESLSVLRLSGNRLTGLGGRVFRCTPNLMEIYLDGNQIRSLHDATFSELPRLEVINLSQNKLPALPPRLLERVSSSSLKTFDLENNSISLMPDRFFSSKPELPYVYLSRNPWLCSCAVGYLHSYLNDQEHNVYKHEEPNGVVPGADSVVCSGPPHLFQRPIVELEENDFCPPDPPLYPSGDQDFKPISVNPNSISQTLNAPHDTTTIKSWTSDGSWVTPESWTETWFEFWTKWEYFILTPTTGPVTFTTQSITSQPTTSESPTTGPNTARSQRPSTAQLDPHSSRTMIMVQTKPPTTGPNTARSQRPSTAQQDLHSSRTMITVQTKPPTTGPITARFQRPSTAQQDLHSSRTMITVQTKPPTTGPNTARSQRPSTAQQDLHSSRTMITVQTKPPTTGPNTARSQRPSTAQLDPHSSRTMIMVQTKPPTTGPNTARSQRPSTAQQDLHSSRTMITVQTKPPTTGPITARFQRPSTAQQDLHSSRTMITVQTKPPTTGPNTARSQRPSTAQQDLHSSRTMITVQTKPPTTGPITAGSQRQNTTRPEPYNSRTTVTVQTERIIPQTSVAPHWADARDAGGRMLPWCWWLFAGFVLLCVLSALTSCFLSLWLLRIYLAVYRRLKHHGMGRSGNDGVILRAYRSTGNSQGRKNEGESVRFLALEQLKDTRAVFRSVLFINQREEQHRVRETKGRDVSSKIELVSVAGEARDKEREPTMSGEVFRKTLYRVINREEEADGWREGTTARYRLILREERGRQPETQWVVGEWELGDEGVAYQRSCSLIGQPSTVALE